MDYESGTTSHYRDASYYDYTYSTRKADIRFYTEIAEELGGPILELGVGTGRVAKAIVKKGVSVVGVDSVPEMLERAQEERDKLSHDEQERLTLKQGDLKTVRLGRQFPLVISPFNVWMHLYQRADIEAAFATVLAHLAPGGTFVFDVLNPWVQDLARNPEKVYGGAKFKHPDTGIPHSYAEAFNYDLKTQVQRIFMFAQPDGAPEDAWQMEVAHRQFFPAELEALLHYNGFEMVERFGNFKRRPFTKKSDAQVIIAKARP